MHICDWDEKYILSAKKKTWPSAKGACEKAHLILAELGCSDNLTNPTLTVHYAIYMRLRHKIQHIYILSCTGIQLPTRF